VRPHYNAMCPQPNRASFISRRMSLRLQAHRPVMATARDAAVVTWRLGPLRHRSHEGVKAGSMACTPLDIFVSSALDTSAGHDLGCGATERLDGVASLVLRRRGVRAFSDARRCERHCAYFRSVSAVADKKPGAAR
jgi:hypothetical protein